MSADPLAVHGVGRGTLNVYAYVDGKLLIAVDPVGLDGFLKSLVDSVKQGSFGPASPLGQHLAHGDYPTLQNDAAMKHLQNQVLAGTVGVEFALATGGIAANLGAGALTISGAGAVAGGAGGRAQLSALEGGTPKQQLREAADPVAVGNDAAMGVMGAGVLKAAAPVIARAAARTLPTPKPLTSRQIEAIGDKIVEEILGPSSPANDNASAPYSRSLYGGSKTNGPAAKDIRVAAEGQPCPKCGQAMISGTKTAPSPQHDPPLFKHWTEGPGPNMTQTEREAYADSPDAFDGANCLTCQRREGAQLAAESRQMKNPGKPNDH